MFTWSRPGANANSLVVVVEGGRPGGWGGIARVVFVVTCDITGLLLDVYWLCIRKGIGHLVKAALLYWTHRHLHVFAIGCCSLAQSESTVNVFANVMTEDVFNHL